LPWLHLPNDIWGWVPVVKLLIVQLRPFSCHVNIFLRTLFSNTLSLSFTPIKKNWQNYGFVYFNLYISGQQAEWQKTQNRMLASILWI
jgi:hypothetical protein